LHQFPGAAPGLAARGTPAGTHPNSFLTPPLDGTGPAARAVDAAAAAGVLWVNSAGNFAQRHWRGAGSPGGRCPAGSTPAPGSADIVIALFQFDAELDSQLSFTPVLLLLLLLQLRKREAFSCGC